MATLALSHCIQEALVANQYLLALRARDSQLSIRRSLDSSLLFWNLLNRLAHRTTGIPALCALWNCQNTAAGPTGELDWHFGPLLKPEENFLLFNGPKDQIADAEGNRKSGKNIP